MQALDPSMIETIIRLRDLLLIGEISLLENLFSVCYDRYSDEELQALFGIKRSKMDYQNGAKSLKESYFEAGQNSPNLPILRIIKEKSG